MTIAHKYHPLHIIDTAPLGVRFTLLSRAVLECLAAGQMSDVLRYSRKLLRVVRVFTRLDGANVLTRRKLDMLMNRAWRTHVLRALGGRRKLALWEAAKARIESRIEARMTRAPVQPSASVETPAWLYTAERLAESERLKARVRLCQRASTPDYIFRDRVKMDFDGLFRLAPLPRGERAAAQIKVYTQETISGYNWNPIPFAAVEGFGPAMVWPAEFYAAMIADGEMEAAEAANYAAGAHIHNSVIPDKGATRSSGTQEEKTVSEDRSRIISATRFVRDDRKKKRDDRGEKLDDRKKKRDDRVEGRDDKEEKRDNREDARDDKGENGSDTNIAIPLLPLQDVLSSKTYRALFEDPV